MNLILKTTLVGMIALAFFLSFQGGEAKAQDGKKLYTTKGCAACHGPDGNTPILPIYPKLAGQNAPYLEAQLKAFKTQQRKSGQSALMWGMAAQLSDGDIKQISAYLASLK